VFTCDRICSGPHFWNVLFRQRQSGVGSALMVCCVVQGCDHVWDLDGLWGERFWPLWWE
jgi:hypothetical protein